MRPLPGLLYFLLFAVLLSSCKIEKSAIRVSMRDVRAISNGKAVITLTTQSLLLTETDSNAIFNNFFVFTLSHAVETDTVISITSNSALATSPGDYTLSASSITIAAGQLSGVIGLEIVGDIGEKEPDKTIEFDIAFPASFSPSTETVVVTLIDNDPLNLVVAPFYPINGANWNDYVATNLRIPLTRYLKNTADTFASESPCPASSFFNCWHGGELKKVTVSSEVSCQGLELEDSEGAFSWKCQENGNSPIYFYSIGFNEGKGLINFINSSGDNFLDLKVILKKNGVVAAESAFARWWSNPIIKYDSTNINSSGGSRLNLTTAGAIYTFHGNITSRGIDLNADRASVVITSGSELTASASTNSTDCLRGDVSVQSCFLFVFNKSKTWIEGRMDVTALTGSMDGISYNNPFATISKLNRIHNLKMKGAITSFYNLYFSQISDSIFTLGAGGIEGSNASSNYFYDLKFSSVSGNVIKDSVSGFGSAYFNIDISNSTSTGISLGQNNSSLSYFRITNSNLGVLTQGLQSVITNGLVASNGTGLSTATSSFMLVGNLTVANNTNYGLNYGTATNTNLFNILSVHNDVGLRTGSNNVNHSNLYLIGNINHELRIPSGAANLNFMGNLMIGGLISPCNHQGAVTNVGVGDVTCAQSSGNAFNLDSGIDENDIFRGFTNDAVNASGASGLSGLTWSSVLDWFSFESFGRVWSKYDSAPTFPNTNLLGSCNSVTCGIYDYNLSSTSVLTNTNGTFYENAACPDITKGSNRISQIINSNNYEFLKGATELILDGYGNDNGLCETNERCFFHPDAGAFLRKPWSFTKTCNYDADGSALTNVIMFGE